MSTKLISTIHHLLDEYGLDLIGNPLRIEAFLRDLHPNEPQKIFLLLEVVHSGLISQIRQKKPRLDSELEGYAAKLTAISGIVPRLAFWAIQTWANLLPEEAFVAQEEEPEKTWQGTIADYFGSFD